MRNVFEEFESNVRTYSRRFPAVFTRAKGAQIWDVAGRPYIDLFAGAGALNYGHNPDELKSGLITYIENDGISHALDLATEAKAAFMADFADIVLVPRGLTYRMMFPGPAGTNAVEAALKLARKITGRASVAAFTNGFHGMSLGALAATGSRFKRQGAGIPLGLIDRLPFDGYFGPDIDTIAMIERLLDDPSSGIDPPAAFLVELVQGEGGLHVASSRWMQRLAALARAVGSLLIVDDVQAGCGRTGPFFSFETTGITPDLICLSKSLSGYGLPLALVLIRPDLDIWKPGEHNGTFRGNNLAFVTARGALSFWQDEAFRARADEATAELDDFLRDLVAKLPPGAATLRGRGLMRGLALQSEALASAVSAEAFRRQVLIETSGGHDEVLKFMPPLTISPDLLADALDRIRSSVLAVIANDAPELRIATELAAE
jgi:diaminobutyrate-2-oxoglutarate transaminase